MTATLEPMRQTKRVVSSKLLLQAIAQLWTMSDLMRLFGKSEQTINIWIKKENLPIVRIPGERRDTIRFDRGDVLTWARTTGRRIFLVPDAEAGTDTASG